MIVYAYTVEFLRFADRDNLRGKGLTSSQDLNKFKLSIRDKFGLQVIYNFVHAQNVVVRAEAFERWAGNSGFYCKNQLELLQSQGGNPQCKEIRSTTPEMQLKLL